MPVLSPYRQWKVMLLQDLPTQCLREHIQQHLVVKAVKKFKNFHKPWWSHLKI